MEALGSGKGGGGGIGFQMECAFWVSSLAGVESASAYFDSL